jgi:hypothetical protein
MLHIRIESLPKVLYGSSLYETKENDFDRTVDFINSSLNELGYQIKKNDILDANFSRIDFCKNLEVNHHIADYIRLLSNFEMSRTDKTEFKNETLTFYNTLRQFTFYNKIQQIKQDKKISAEERNLVKDMPENILRVESRKLKNRAVVNTFKRQIKMKELFDCEVCKKDLLENYDKLVLAGESTEELNFNEDLKILKRLGFNNFMMKNGVDAFLKRYNYDYKLIRKLLNRVYTRQHSYSQLKRIKKLQSDTLTPHERDLLEEIRYKLAA